VSLRAAARELAEQFRAAGVPEPEFEAELLARRVAGVDRAAYFAGAPLTDDAAAQLTKLGTARLDRQPAAYLFGDREFYGLSFLVGPGVLVPRPETEMLVEFGLAELQANPRAVVVDVGTGSGCVAVSVAATSPTGTVIATERSTVALGYSRQNAARHAPRVRLVQADLASPIERADVVLANLPYIPAGEIDALEPEVSKHEPRIALDGGGDGLGLIRRLVSDCAQRLRPSLLALEVGFGQASQVAALFEGTGATVSVHRDLSGIDRIVAARW
jgi:release factor glutamine methyltransferase